jgi:hypothetical protein
MLSKKRHNNVKIIVPLNRNRIVEIGSLGTMLGPQIRDAISSMGFPFPIAISNDAFCRAIGCSNERAFSGVLEFLRIFCGPFGERTPSANVSLRFRIENRPSQPLNLSPRNWITMVRRSLR